MKDFFDNIKNKSLDDDKDKHEIEKRELFRYTDGSTYEGEWLDDKRHGKGVMIYAEGNKYVGEWQNDMCHGQGKYYYRNGDVHEGDWKDDQANGFCKFTYSLGEYIG